MSAQPTECPTLHESSAVMLLAYGTPDSMEDVEAYFTHIRGGRRPSPESVENLRERYRSIGGTTPLTRITNLTARELALELGRRGTPMRVFIGMKHWHPYIADAVRSMCEQNIDDVVALVLAPHYSRMSVGGYRKAFEEASRDLPMATTFIEQWHTHPGFIEFIEQRVRDAIRGFHDDKREDVAIVFSAHSLPEKIRTWNDPYESQLLESCQLVADRLGLEKWNFAWQSAGNTGEPWIGPDICDFLQELRVAGVKNVLSVPIGFVSDHLEVLYDIDREAKQKASELGMHLRRIEMPNADPAFIRVLADIVTDARRP